MTGLANKQVILVWRQSYEQKGRYKPGILVIAKFNGSAMLWKYSAAAKSTANLGTVFDTSVAATLAAQGSGAGIGVWELQFSGDMNANWFEDGADDDSARAINAAIVASDGAYKITHTGHPNGWFIETRTPLKIGGYPLLRAPRIDLSSTYVYYYDNDFLDVTGNANGIELKLGGVSAATSAGHFLNLVGRGYLYNSTIDYDSFDRSVSPTKSLINIDEDGTGPAQELYNNTIRSKRNVTKSTAEVPDTGAPLIKVASTEVPPTIRDNTFDLGYCFGQSDNPIIDVYKSSGSYNSGNVYKMKAEAPHAGIARINAEEGSALVIDVYDTQNVVSMNDLVDLGSQGGRENKAVTVDYARISSADLSGGYFDVVVGDSYETTLSLKTRELKNLKVNMSGNTTAKVPHMVDIEFHNSQGFRTFTLDHPAYNAGVDYGFGDVIKDKGVTYTANATDSMTSGDRTGAITVTSDLASGGTTDPSHVVNGADSTGNANAFYITPNNSPAAGVALLTFQFATPQSFSGAMSSMSNSMSAIVKWQGSVNGTDWVDLSGAHAHSTGVVIPFTDKSTVFSHLRIMGISGVYSFIWQQETFFYPGGSAYGAPPSTEWLAESLNEDLGAVSGAVAIDFENNTSAKITLSGNATIALLDPTVTGVTVSLHIVQDATGGHAITWPANVLGDLTGLDTAANSEQIVQLYFDGTNYHV